ncbi:MAG: hypothetical protein Q9182_000640 [Xanthomendoza sp. 2 TL-2023]
MARNLSNLLRLVPLEPGDLPFHPALELSDEQKRPDMRAFVKTILDDAIYLVDETLRTEFKPCSLKSSAPAEAKVQVFKHEITAQEISKVNWMGSKIPRHPPDNVRSEAWFARRSSHANRQAPGTANLNEFDYGLRVDHSEHEGEYTPDVLDTYKVLDWTIPSASSEEEANFGDYKNVTMSNILTVKIIVFEMCHKLPFPLTYRVFPVLVVTAKTGANDFTIAQLPVKIDALKEAFYSNGRNLKEEGKGLKSRPPIIGFVQALQSKCPCWLMSRRSIYTSVERCVLRHNDEIEWTMATASDAKGWLPMWSQKLGIPGAVTKDVGYLIKWIHEKRGARE